MIRTIYRSSKGGVTTEVPEAHWKTAVRDAGGLFWVDIASEPKDAVERLLTQIFDFHPLAIDDALRESHVPKVDDWGTYLYAVLHGIAFNRAATELETNEIDIFLGRNYLVTYHDKPAMPADRTWATCQRDPRYLARGADFLLYHLTDNIVADYMPAVDDLDEAIDQLEDDVFAKADSAVLNRLFAVKRAVLHLRRIISPQREVLNRLARDTYEAIDPSEKIYFRDVYDHLVRLADINDTLRDLIGGTLDTYLSVSSNRINEIMKVLTVFTALFMPVTFVTGFFGMNFEYLPIGSLAVFVSVVGLTALIPLTMWQWFKRQGWV